MKLAHAFLHRLLVVVGGAALVIMMLHITAAVLLRAFFDINIPGTLETVSFYYMVFAVFAGLALVTLLYEQVVVEVFLNWMSSRALRIVDAFGALLGLIYAGILVYGAWLEGKSAMKFGEMVPVRGIDIPIWPSRWIAFAGLAIVAVTSAAHFITFLRRNKEDKA